MVAGEMQFRERTGFTRSREEKLVKTTIHNRLRFEIVADHPDVGYYLYVYDGDRCIADHLQNDEETCKQVAFDDYGVDIASWDKDKKEIGSEF